MLTQPGPEPVTSKSHHLPALDGLRGLAILLVVPHNADFFDPVKNFLWPVGVLAHTGWIGVQLFFVLSGFLISSNLLDSKTAKNYFSSFYMRRVLRIFPLYFGTLFVAFVVLPRVIDLSPEQIASNAHQIWLWTFLSNWVQPFGLGVNSVPHFWSLAVEEQFYLLWPFLVLRFSTARLLNFCYVLIGTAFLVRTSLYAAGVNSQAIYMFSVCRMDALAFGAAAACIMRMPVIRERIRPNNKKLTYVAFVIVLAGALLGHVYDTRSVGTITFGYSLLALSAALMILAAGLGPEGDLAWWRKALQAAWLRSVGKYSFAMYVFSTPIQHALKAPVYDSLHPLTALAPLIYVLVVALASYVAAVVSYWAFERHFLQLKKYFVPA